MRTRFVSSEQNPDIKRIKALRDRRSVRHAERLCIVEGPRFVADAARIDRPWLLVVSEDGQAWLVQAQSGEIDGPRDIGSPPAVGPALTRSGVSVQFADGRVAVWTDRLEPIFYQADAIVGGPFAKESLIAPNVTTLRRSANVVPELVSPGNGWKVFVTDTEYRVVSTDGRGFSAERVGEWVYVAWEAPKALVPHGRLWVSDEAGLRSYLPDLQQMVPFPAQR